MNAHDWFDDHNVKGMLKDLVTKLESNSSDDPLGTHSDDTNLDIFLRGLKDIVRSAHHFPDVVPRVLRAVLEAEEHDDASLNDMMHQVFNNLTYHMGNEYELLGLKYREGAHKVEVDFEIKDEGL